MFSRRSLPILLTVLVAGVFIAFRSLGTGNDNPPGRYEKILHNVGEMLTEIHYSPKDINDKFSKEVFKKYLALVDQDKGVFLQSDINELRKFETKVDDEILGGPVTFVPASFALFNKRLPEVEKLYKEILAQPFDFTKDETFVGDPEKRDYPANEAERKNFWHQRLKYLVLDRYVDMQEAQEKNKGKQGTVVRTNEQMEKDAREKVLKAMDRTFENYKIKLTEGELFSRYVNTITQTMDPHTDYFPPLEKRSFDEEMSGKFYGIGASLLYDEGNIKVNSILTGSPAYKSGEITVGDIVLKVAQGDAEPVELAGYYVQDAVKIIRGKKGTEVRLTLRKADGSIKVVKLIRDEIVQDETFARSSIVTNGKAKIGFIYLPEFYADFDDPKGRRCADDVAKEIIRLKEQKVDGIILDLRNNGGGSLYDVVKMVGLFVDEGPVVQVRDRDGKPSVLRDRDKNVLYEGPLAVMVNEFSASASEIFAAAIQDYKRGLIIGSTSTYGKGTVQRNIGLDKTQNFMSANSDLGTIKLTLQKFYRINGGSTQLKGVASDIVLPDFYEYSKLREKDDPDALPWDEIQKADYSTWKYSFDANNIRSSSQARVSVNPAFNLIKTNTEWLAKENDRVYSLNIDKFRDEKKKVSATYKQLETLNKLPKELVVTPLQEDSTKYANDKDKDDRFKAWLKSLRNDLYLDETVNVMNDMVNQHNMALNQGQKKLPY
ncbi:MAG TPA: carboxy terminal-processing peptidase [Chitinophagaceae bacterium]|nr:carboxy terminal-processing peptidase [Chitinophagaceae bacterium]